MIEYNFSNYFKLYLEWFAKIGFLYSDTEKRILDSWEQDGILNKNWNDLIQNNSFNQDTTHPMSFVYFTKNWLYKQKVDMLLK